MFVRNELTLRVAQIAQTQSGAKLGKEEINQLVHQVVGDIHWVNDTDCLNSPPLHEC